MQLGNYELTQEGRNWVLQVPNTSLNKRSGKQATGYRTAYFSKFSQALLHVLACMSAEEIEGVERIEEVIQAIQEAEKRLQKALAMNGISEWPEDHPRPKRKKPTPPKTVTVNEGLGTPRRRRRRRQS